MAHLKQFQHLKIQLDVIKKATKDFSNESCIGRGGFGEVYKGKIADSAGHEMVALKRLNRRRGQGDVEFWKEVMLLSQYKHENIVSLIGFCDDSGEKILVYPYASNRSLDRHLNNDDLGWIGRLQICIGAAQGLAYLHSAIGAQQRVLHRDIKSSNILLDEDWNAKISDFGLSKLGPANQDNTFLYSHAVGTLGYVDPVYVNTGLLTKESDVYSFGVVLFEVLCGRLCIDKRNDKHPDLIELVRKSYKENAINEIVYGNIKDEINPNSLFVFANIAYECLETDPQLRPLMSAILVELDSAFQYQVRWSENRNLLVKVLEQIEQLKIQLHVIKSATNNFSKKSLLGIGGSGAVYKGNIVGYGTVALKRLNPTFRQGKTEFRKEVRMLSLYKHENIVPLLGFCDNSGEKILVYPYVPNRSLAHHLTNKSLRWIDRLVICIEVARGLEYLYREVGGQQRVSHRAIESHNILLDEDWCSMISDFGLSKFAPTNVGTSGYVDPILAETGLLTKESGAVYSFGVVMLEVLCGRLCIDKRNAHPYLIPLAREYLNKFTIKEMVYGSIKGEIITSSLNVFVEIADRCLTQDHEERPSMTRIVEDLETALRYQVSKYVFPIQNDGCEPLPYGPDW